MKRAEQISEAVSHGDGKEELYSRVVNKVSQMSADQLFASMVATGVYTESGELTKEYGGQAQAKK